MNKMIVQHTYIVTGKKSIDDDILFCRNLMFPLGESKLVIVPKKKAEEGEQRVLKIIADKIYTGQDGDAEITYNLDGDMTFPLVNTGLDPETKAKDGRTGNPNFRHGVLPDRASPHFDAVTDPLHWTGVYPKAKDGGDGKHGGKGNNGREGQNAPIVEVWVNQIHGKGLLFDLRGQKGGDGGKGGNGQYGGNGQKGSDSVVGTEASWTGIPITVCKQRAGMGGDGGRGGDAGCGGDGGGGGNGGLVKIFYTSTAASGLSILSYALEGGKGGKGGESGIAGKGGKAGPNGINLAECVPPLKAKDGSDGSTCQYLEESPARDGEDGSDGYYRTYQIERIPELPGLWP